MELNFTKLHGLGNDFVFIDDFNESIELTAEQVAFLCDRHFGIGGDGVVLVRPSKRPECAGYMHYINSDGTLAEMCGNGVRCFTKFLVDHGYVDPNAGSYIADTKRGPLPISFELNDQGLMSLASVDMDEPILDPEKVPANLPAEGCAPNGSAFIKEASVESPWGNFEFTCVSMGNPHCVVFEDPDGIELDAVGPLFEKASVFPQRVNTEFVQKTGERSLKMRVWERGSGETLACGTGACAAAAASVAIGMFPRGEDITVRLPGGELVVNVGDRVLMTGEARMVFTGETEL